jgi:hypothetical protein
MEQFTIGIPTIWKSERINKLVTDLNSSVMIGEILIIDNLHQYDGRFNELLKVRVIQPEENLYVNPAWNRIVKESKNNLVALLNDDINFDVNIFESFNEELLLHVGITGMGQENYQNTQFEGEPIITDAQHTSDWGWGCFLLLHKSQWVDIPNELKIWYGDNFIKTRNPYPNGTLRGFPIETEMSTTSDLDEVRGVRDRDTHLWNTNNFFIN